MLVFDLELKGGRVLELSEAALQSGNLIIAVIIVLVMVPQNP